MAFVTSWWIPLTFPPVISQCCTHFFSQQPFGKGKALPSLDWVPRGKNLTFLGFVPTSWQVLGHSQNSPGRCWDTVTTICQVLGHNQNSGSICVSGKGWHHLLRVTQANLNLWDKCHHRWALSAQRRRWGFIEGRWTDRKASRWLSASSPCSFVASEESGDC